MALLAYASIRRAEIDVAAVHNPVHHVASGYDGAGHQDREIQELVNRHSSLLRIEDAFVGAVFQMDVNEDETIA